MMIPIPAFAFSLLLSTAALLPAVVRSQNATEAPGVCDIQADECIYQNDGLCDVPDFCDAGSDCVDCSPCQQYRFAGCEACTTATDAECFWCGADEAACLPIGAPLIGPPGITYTCTAEDDVTECPANENPFPDPLFDSMNWAFELINIKPVWAAGISK